VLSGLDGILGYVDRKKQVGCELLNGYAHEINSYFIAFTRINKTNHKASKLEVYTGN
jgi:hypothetical protein